MLQAGIANGLLAKLGARVSISRALAAGVAHAESSPLTLSATNVYSHQSHMPVTVKWLHTNTQPAVNSATVSTKLPSSWEQWRGFSAPPAGPEGTAPPGGPDPLREGLMTIVNACVEKVEANDMEGAIELLRDGISKFEPQYEGRPEVGELHNQLSLLLFFSANADAAAPHAEIAFEITKKVFGEQSPLTGHRLLRLGVIRFAQGRLTESANMLKDAATLIKDDNSRHEIEMYLTMEELSHATDGSEVEQLDAQMAAAVKEMNQHFGTHSIVLSLAMGNHAAMVNRLVSSQPSNVRVYEALYKQHAKLLEVLDPNGEDLALCNFKLASFYYSQDMLAPAATCIQNSTRILLATYPEDHQLVMMCKHRFGMICAASGDHRSAVQLLIASKDHFNSSIEGGAPPKDLVALVKEADLGLEMASFYAIAGTGEKVTASKKESLKRLEHGMEYLSEAIGGVHMLVAGAHRYYSQMCAMVK